MRISDQLKIIQQQLQPRVENACLEAELLLAFSLNKERTYLYAYPDQLLTSEQEHKLHQYLERRLHGEPLAYITGHKEFWSLDFLVKPGVLIPRAETELLVETILAMFPQQRLNIAELGTGSGAISIALAFERPDWQIYASDISYVALELAKQNAQRLGSKNISFHLGNWFTAFPCKNLDIVVSNPPYIAEDEWMDYQAGLAYEPVEALVSGKYGLDAIREIVQQARYYLKPEGYLLLEHGFVQGDAVRKIFTEYGFQQADSKHDLAGKERITFAGLAKK